MDSAQLTKYFNSVAEVLTFETTAFNFATATTPEVTALIRMKQFGRAADVVRKNCQRIEEVEARWRSLTPPEELKNSNEAMIQIIHNVVAAMLQLVEAIRSGQQVRIGNAFTGVAEISRRIGPMNSEYKRHCETLAAHIRLTEAASKRAALKSGATALTGALGQGHFTVILSKELPTFADVGGMESFKGELRDTLGLLLKHPDMAQQFGINWNGILLYGPPGSGKTFLARAVAGEFGLNFLSVGTAELSSKWRGESAKLIEQAFAVAKRHLPCLLFFDEFDSVAADRENNPNQEDRGVVNQLLRSLETCRDVRQLVVMAATNDLDHLDEAAVRPGRFDRRIRVEYPDQEGRKAILAMRLAKLPTQEIELDLVARRCHGFSAATIVEIVQQCAMDAFRRRTSGETDAVVRTEDLLAAIDRRGGQDRPLVEQWNWDDLILNPGTKAEHKQIQAFIEQPELAESFGITPPSGLLLYGPPGTGKTTIAKVLAAETRASFYPISSSDIVSKWVGESERNVAKLFDRARENRPSIIFIDEIDTLFPTRSMVTGNGAQDRLVNTFLGEIDGIGGQQGVFLVGATNRRDILDPALLRGGRLSRQIEISLPDQAARVQLLGLYTKKMPINEINLDSLAEVSQGLSGADLKAACQEAAMVAAMRAGGDAEERRVVTESDFLEALARVSK